MTDRETLRAFALKLKSDAEDETQIVGEAGAWVSITKAEVAGQLIALLDGLPPPTSPDRIPPAIRASLDRYASIGIRTGDCLYHILAGDLFGAFARADVETAAAMPAIVAYITGQLPAGCHGSEELVERWIARPRS